MNNILNLDNSDKEIESAFNELERAIYLALETYSNVHRGSGHHSLTTTALFEEARIIILEYLKLNRKEYYLVFCSPLRLKIFKTQLKPIEYCVLSSKDFGLPLGIRAIAVKKKTLKKCSAIYTGGGMIKHVTSKYVIWADPPQKFEAGTPNILNIIGFAAFIQLRKNFRTKSKIWKESLNEILYQDELGNISGIELLKRLQKLLIGGNIKVPTKDGMNYFINLDNAASTPSFYPIWNVFCKTLRQPIEIHREIIKEVKNIIARFLNAPLENYDIIFTLNTTEAINIVARSLAIKFNTLVKPIIVNTILEHHSNELPFRYISRVKLIRVSVDDKGFIDLNELEGILSKYNQIHKHGIKRVELVAVSAASNFIGTRNDLKAISKIVHKYGAKLLVDGAQIVAHHKVNITDLNIDFFAFSGHKIYAPFGSGVLLVKKGLLSYNPNEFKSILLSGEENIVGIATLGKALLLLKRIGIDVIESYEKNLTQIVLDGLNKIRDIIIFGIGVPFSNIISNPSNIISFNLLKVPHNVSAKELAEYGGIGVRNGCFCAHMLIQKILKLQRIRVIGARMTSIIFPKRTALCLPGTLRVSIGIENNEKDVNLLLKTIEKMVKKPRSIIDKLFGRTNNGTLFVPKTKTEEVIKFFVSRVIKKVYSI